MNYIVKIFLLGCFTFVMLFEGGCCSKKRYAPPSPVIVKKTKKSTLKSGGRNQKKIKINNKVVEQVLPELKATGLQYSISVNNSKSMAKNLNFSPGSFEDNYVKAVKLMAEKKYGDAIRIFEELSKRATNPEYASIAALCVAEVYFRNKANARALQIYEEIVKKYPRTQAAENAKAGIAYLKNFHKYEKEYISPDEEDKKRHGF